MLGQEVKDEFVETKLGKKWYVCHLVITEERSGSTRIYVVGRVLVKSICCWKKIIKIFLLG